MREFIEDGVAKPDIYFLYKVDKVQCTSYQQMIRIIYLQKLNAQIDIIYIPSKKNYSHECSFRHFLEGSQSTITYLNFPKCYIAYVLSNHLLEKMQSHISFLKC